MPSRAGLRFALALTAASSIGALLAPDAAFAVDRVVTFSGGCGIFGVGSWSQPDVGSLTVPIGGMVHFVNHLGDAAELTINGAIRGMVPPDNEIDVVFRQGMVTVGMVPGCLLGTGDAGTVSVRVRDSAVADPPPVAQGGPSPSPAGQVAPPPATNAPPPPPGSAATTRGNAGAGTVPGGVRQPARPPAVHPTTVAPTPDVAASTGAASPGGASTVVPSLAGPAGVGSPEPSTSELSAAAAAAVGPAIPVPPARRGASGVLVLVASVCAAGVSIAAIRAMITQHAISVKST